MISIILALMNSLEFSVLESIPVDKNRYDWEDSRALTTLSIQINTRWTRTSSD